MNLIFFGSDQYSAVALKTILAGLPGDSRKVQVVTDKHEGSSPVEQLAIKHSLPVSYYPATQDEKTNFIGTLVQWFNGSIPLGLCASFDHLIPIDVISRFEGNLYNLHPSLLPQYRNVSPVQYAVALGDKETGITLFRISPGIDDGEIIAQTSEPILESDTTTTLTPRLFKKGAELFLQMIQGSELCLPPQKNKVPNLVFTKRLKKDSGFIEWPVLEKLLADKKVESSETKNELLALRLTHNPAGQILYDLLRALSPWPGVWSLIPTTKGEVRVSLESILPDITLKLAGKPKAISLKDFEKYYL